MNDLTHISLFSGIGGFDLAAEWEGFRTIAMCEIDPFCQEVLAARFGAVADASDTRLPGSQRRGSHNESGEAAPRPTPQRHPILIPDIRDFDGSRFRGATLLTGGFPCQPFSHAGKRKGKDDDRHLWPQMLRVIREARPAWVVAENVAGLISMELHQVLADLEGAGYEVDSYVVPACAVNAPHRRDRVWIVAHAENNAALDELSPQDPLDGGNGGRGDGDTPRLRRTLQTARPDSDAPDAAEQGLPHRRGASMGEPEAEQEPQRCGGDGHPAEQWDIPWIEVAQRFCSVAYELPDRLAGYRFAGETEAHAKVRDRHRTQKLKALGNAIVPAVAFQIISAIKEIELGNKT